MNVILSVEALSPNLSGIGRYTLELASRLPKLPGMSTVRYYRNKQWLRNPGDLLDASPELSPVRSFKKCIKPPQWLREKALKWQCRGKLFHGPNYFLPPCADIGVATVHDLSVFKFPETHPAERIRQFEQAFVSSMSRASHLITDSEATRQEVIDFLAWPPEKITAVPLGVSTRFAPRSPADLTPCLRKYGLSQGAYTLCVSTLEPRKKISNLLQAYRLLPQAVRERYSLVIIGGKGWLNGALHEEITQLTAQGWLRYLGYVPEADLPMLYAGAATFIYPSCYEGFGLPVLEAMASEVPVVTSDRSALPEVTQGAALLTDPDDINAFANCINASLFDETWRISAKKSGLQVASRYSWERCIDRTVDVYKRIDC